nr:DUF4309 domain-containing protein [Paenibacillus hamazuiensis]
MMLITGCKQTESAERAAGAVNTPEPITVVPAHQDITPAVQAPSAVNAAQLAGQPEEAHPGDKVTLSSAEQSGAAQEKTAEPNKPASSPAPTPKPKVEVQESYSQAKPSLMGLTMKTSPETVIAKFGEPKEQFTMDDDTDPLTVFDYTDFTVGFNKQKQLQFVDVRSAEVDPGLNGLTLGQTVEDAYNALGKPDSNTSYVLSYKSEGTVLKLDVDPKSGQITSIKLFSGK